MKYKIISIVRKELQLEEGNAFAKIIRKKKYFERC
jgi:hypothetical protein